MTPGAWSVLWPLISGLLAIALLWVLVHRRREANPEVPDWQRIAAEDAVSAIAKLQRRGQPVLTETLAGTLGASVPLAEGVVNTMGALGWIRQDTNTTGGLQLTDQGRTRAQQLVRAHRLWEQYLAKRQGMPLEALHAEADRREHATSPEETAQLDAELGYPAWDPHGHIIPDAGRGVPQTSGIPLLQCTAGQRLRVTHVDDEPLALFAQLVGMGLTPGAEVEIGEMEAKRCWVKVNGRSMPLARPAAERVYVLPVPVLPVPLGELPRGASARVAEIRGSGKHQRRILDLGLVPGARVKVVRTAPLGDPVEYLVKDTAVSMRRSDANTVLVDEETEQEDD